MVSINKHIKLLASFIFLGFGVHSLIAQDEDFDLLGDEVSSVREVGYAFKTNRVINLQSLESTSKGVLDFKMFHRFGAWNSGFYEGFGLDQATVRFGFDYGLTNKCQLSMGRSNVNQSKNVDALVKYRFLQQKTEGMPISLLGVFGTQYLLGSRLDSILTNQQRASYFGQLIIGSKVNENLSVQFSPTFLYNTSHAIISDPNTQVSQQWAFGIGMRYKVSTRSSINVEYIPILTDKGSVYNSFSVGMDLETGGHVFQFQLTNSMGLNEAQFISNTTNQWNNAGIRLGFNLSRVFTIVKPKEL
jgi:hypothetical protein